MTLNLIWKKALLFAEKQGIAFLILLSITFFFYTEREEDKLEDKQYLTEMKSEMKFMKEEMKALRIEIIQCKDQNRDELIDAIKTFKDAIGKMK